MIRKTPVNYKNDNKLLAQTRVAFHAVDAAAWYVAL